jgi:hypothetical protein
MQARLAENSLAHRPRLIFVQRPAAILAEAYSFACCCLVTHR